MKPVEYYRETLKLKAGIPRETMLKALAAARYGAQYHSSKTLEEIAERYSIDAASYTSTEALALLDRAESEAAPRYWRQGIEQSPVPPWAIRAALDDLGVTQAELADRLDTSTRAVEFWLAGDRQCKGPAGVAVREILKKIAADVDPNNVRV